MLSVAETGRTDPDLHGDGGQQDGHRIQPLWLDHPQTGVYLWWSGSSPTEITRNFGTAWGIGGWLLTAFLRKIGPEAAQKLRERVAAEIKTTFASRYTRTVSLAEALQLDAISVYSKQATGEKYLINPHKGVRRASSDQDCCLPDYDNLLLHRDSHRRTVG